MASQFFSSFLLVDQQYERLKESLILTHCIHLQNHLLCKQTGRKMTNGWKDKWMDDDKWVYEE